MSSFAAGEMQVPGSPTRFKRVLSFSVSVVIAPIIVLLALGGYSWQAQGAGSSPAVSPNAKNLENSKTAGSQRSVSFGGEVWKGESFERPIDGNLFFRLVPQELGWTISVGSAAGQGNNFCGVVTPPYRGINPIQIEGWHFRNADNSGPNEAGPTNVNAPQKIREFYFVINDADYSKAFDALQIMLWPYSYSKRQIDEAGDVHAKVAKGNGRLFIRDLKLNTLELGKQAGIERLVFDVELNFPR
jgi:hypothetical protein